MNVLEQTSDDALLKRYAEQNDRDALGVLFRRHADAAYATARRVCRNSADAEDAVQNAFIKIMENASTYRGGSDMAFKVCLMKFVLWAGKNKIRSEIRRRAREEFADEDQDDVYIPDDPAGQEADLKERAAEILEVLDGLPEQYRQVLWLHYCQGLPVKDAAIALDMPEKTFRNTLEYGLRKLRQKLAAKVAVTSVASIVAVLPFLPSESAPASLVGMINGVVDGIPSKPASGASIPPGKYLLKSAVAALFVAGIAVAVKFAFFSGDNPVPLAPVEAAVTKPMYYHWDFNTPGVPPELKCTQGSVRRVPNGGPDGKGCLEVRGIGGNARLVLDVPISGFPLAVRWRNSWIAVAPKKESSAKVFWFPSHDVASFLGMGELKTVNAEQKIDKWRAVVNYHSGTYIDRWMDGARLDITMGKPDPSGKMIIYFTSDYQIDDLVITSISSNDLPDASECLKVVERIPAGSNMGYVVAPELKPRTKDVPVRLFFIKGYVDEQTALGPIKTK
ncbi:MAG: hypothetical protein C0404_10640 [Verrucomicrobia bacterium]|nr:hypothetical protein [Verrucomicrobiota bacterium]